MRLSAQRAFGSILLILVALVGLAMVSRAQSPPPTLRMPLDPPIYGYALTNAFGSLSFTDPVMITTPPGETNRLFIVEQRGRVAVITNLAAPNRSVFLDISSRVVGGIPNDEQGLLGMAFHPGYATNGYFYLFYSVNSTTPGVGSGLHERVSRFQVSSTNANLAATNEIVLINQFDEAPNHNGGCLQFGPDGYLYISAGDEGDQNGTFGNSQLINRDFFAAIFRIDVDNRPGSLAANPHPANTNNPTLTVNYRIPADNPFVGATSFNGTNISPATVRTEIYAIGFRNPWRFSFDPLSGDLYCADVGQDLWEEIDIVRRGGNYGWNYREGLHARPGSPAPPPSGFAPINPIHEYQHGGATDQGNSVSGGVVYRGNRIPALNGAYIFADYVSGNVWALRANGTNVVPSTRLLGNSSIAGFGVDPRNGDVLVADQNDDMIKRLVNNTNVVAGNALPPTLADTGAFTNLMSLTNQTQPLPFNSGLVPYDINVHFWSDNARKGRWFYLPTNATVGFNRDAHWSFPAGMAWVKHFDLEMTNGVSSSARRLETRIVVKNTNGVYGVTYRWGNSLTNATLVPDEGMDETFTINDGGTMRTQVWHYPSRSECLNCHTPIGGLALGFNTAQLNGDFDYGSGPTNQIAALERAGYFSAPVTNIHSLRSLAPATNDAASLEWRVRSYLAANCAQCHQPGGLGGGVWNAAITNLTANSGIINGPLVNNGGDTNNRVIAPGSLLNSMLLMRISTRGAGQMPPLATSVLDTSAIQLLSAWITNDLPAYQTFAQWQIANFGATNVTNAAASFDPDGDGSPNYSEYIARTQPLNSNDVWRVRMRSSNGQARLDFVQPANRAFEVQWATNLATPTLWNFYNRPENRPTYPSLPASVSIGDSITNAPFKFYRVRLSLP